MNHIAPRLTATPKQALQRTIMTMLRRPETCLGASPWPDLLRSRAARWIELSLPTLAQTFRPEHTMDNLRTIIAHLPRTVTFATLKVLCNGVNTSRRFQADILPCPFCNAPDGDSLEHPSTCPSIWQFAEQHLPIHSPADTSQAATTFFLLVPTTKTIALAVSILNDLLVSSYNARAHGADCTNPLELLHGRLRHLSHRYVTIRDYLLGAFF